MLLQIPAANWLEPGFSESFCNEKGQMGLKREFKISTKTRPGGGRIFKAKSKFSLKIGYYYILDISFTAQGGHHENSN